MVKKNKRSPKEPVQVECHFPVPDDDEISVDLRQIVKALDDAGLAGKATCGIFGGEYGYGADFDCAAFEMHWDRQHPKCNCGGAQPAHKPDCDQITKRQAWLDKRNSIGLVDVPAPPRPDNFDELSPFEQFWIISGEGWKRHTATTDKEQRAWMKANPFPSCSCGEEAAWTKRNGHRPKPDGASYFDRGGDHWRDYKHTPRCDLTIYHERPHFLHKASGSTVDWYKYIGRDMRSDLRAAWREIVRDCLAEIERLRKEPPHD